MAGADGHARPSATATAPDTGLWPALFWLAFFGGFYGYAHRLDLSDLFLTAGVVVGVAALALLAWHAVALVVSLAKWWFASRKR